MNCIALSSTCKVEAWPWVNNCILVFHCKIGFIYILHIKGKYEMALKAN